MARIIIVTSRTKNVFKLEMLKEFIDFQVLNVVILYNSFFKDGRIETRLKAWKKFENIEKVFVLERIPISQSGSIFETAFSDVSISQLNNYSFKIGFQDQKNIRAMDDGTYRAKLLHFFDIVNQKLNSRVSLLRYEKNETKQMNYDFTNKQIDMLLSFVPPKPNLPRLFSYDSNAYCGIVPIPKESPSYLMIFEAFEWRIWATFIGSVIAMGLVWQLFRVKFIKII